MSSTEEKTMEAAKTFFATHIASEFPAKEKIITVQSEDAPSVGFETLIENHILSAPVVVKGSTKCPGFFDIREAVKYILPSRPTKEMDTIVPWTSITRTTSYIAALHPFVSVKEDDTLLKILPKLVHNHRLAVVDTTGKMVNIISQSDMIAMLMGFKDDAALVTLMDRPLGECKGMGTHPVITVQENSSVYECVMFMNEKNLSGIGICDKEGVLLANTSCSDLKSALKHALRGESGRLIDYPIIDFQNAIRREKDIDNHFRTTAAVVKVASSTTLSHLIGRLNVMRIHRVFMCDEAGAPTSVISISDILTYLCKQMNI